MCVRRLHSRHCDAPSRQLGASPNPRVRVPQVSLCTVDGKVHLRRPLPAVPTSFSIARRFLYCRLGRCRHPRFFNTVPPLLLAWGAASPTAFCFTLQHFVSTGRLTTHSELSGGARSRSPYTSRVCRLPERSIRGRNEGQKWAFRCFSRC